MIERFGTLVEAIYASSLCPDNWPDTLERIGNFFGSDGSVLIFYKNNVQANFVHSPSSEKAVRVYLDEEWWRQDIHAQRALELNLQGLDVFDDYEVATPQEMETLPIYVDFFRRVGFGWLMSCVLLPKADSLVALTVTRAKAKGAYTDEEKKVLGLVGRHVEQSLRISRRLEEHDDTEAVLLRALRSIDVGVYALTRNGRIRYANGAGEGLFDRFFDRVDGCMVPKEAADRQGFQALLRAPNEMLRAATTLSARAPTSCVIGGADGSADGGRLAVWAAPMTGASQWRFGIEEPAEILLLATPLERNQSVDPVVIRDILGLTLGEARLASLIGSGMAVRDAAGKLGVTEGTARIVLKKVFRKLEINRQTELVHQISNLAVVASDRGSSGGQAP